MVRVAPRTPRNPPSVEVSPIGGLKICRVNWCVQPDCNPTSFILMPRPHCHVPHPQRVARATRPPPRDRGTSETLCAGLGLPSSPGPGEGRGFIASWQLPRRGGRRQIGRPSQRGQQHPGKQRQAISSYGWSLRGGCQRDHRPDGNRHGDGYPNLLEEPRKGNVGPGSVRHAAPSIIELTASAGLMMSRPSPVKTAKVPAAPIRPSAV